MKRTHRLDTWQVILIAVGAVLVLAPMLWEMLKSSFAFLADMKLDELFTQDGMFAVGIILLSIVGIVEIIKDFRDKPKSKYIK